MQVFALVMTLKLPSAKQKKIAWFLIAHDNVVSVGCVTNRRNLQASDFYIVEINKKCLGRADRKLLRCQTLLFSGAVVGCVLLPARSWKELGCANAHPGLRAVALQQYCWDGRQVGP